MLCDKDSYLLELVRYIHLNPLRAGLVGSLEGLTDYQWSGHAALLGRRSAPWQETDDVLAEFSRDRSRARSRYSAFLADGVRKSRHPDLARGWSHMRGIIMDVESTQEGGGGGNDPRILGGGRFIARVAAKVEAAERRRQRAGRRVSPQAAVRAAAKAVGVSADAIQRPNRRQAVVMGRALACKWLVEDLGMRGVAVAKLLGVTSAAVTQGVQRGRRVEIELGVGLDSAT